MPSPVKSKTRSAAAKPATASTNAVTRTPVRTLNRRQARAVQRALERRRRNVALASVAAIVVVVGLVLVLKDHSPFAGNSSTGHTASNCPAPTATPIGPLPSITAPATPPPVSGKVVNGDQGLQYIDLKAGCGTPIKNGDTVNVLYSGWLQSSGKLFDSSYLHGGSTFPVTVGQGQVIKGWDLGLVGMKLYGERRLIIPAAIAYGAAGQPPTIPANATLVFDVTIVSRG